jgi:Cytosol aminopeptidase family, catalytic domain
VRALDGTTIEVNNTDAEGRLVLGDCLAYARREGAERLLDLATLTGGVVVALGSTYAGLMSNDEAWAARVVSAAERSGEIVWRLPLHQEYAEMIKGRYGQIINSTPKREATALTAGEFLHHFAGDVPWAHLDIAGTAPAVLRRSRGHRFRGATTRRAGARSAARFVAQRDPEGELGRLEPVRMLLGVRALGRGELAQQRPSDPVEPERQRVRARLGEGLGQRRDDAAPSGPQAVPAGPALRAAEARVRGGRRVGRHGDELAGPVEGDPAGQLARRHDDQTGLNRLDLRARSMREDLVDAVRRRSAGSVELRLLGGSRRQRAVGDARERGRRGDQREPDRGEASNLHPGTLPGMTGQRTGE